jgi:hypothetical protein
MGGDSQLTVDVKSGVSKPLRCVLRPAPMGKAAAAKDQPMFVAAFFRYHGRPCGKIMRYLEMVKGRLQWKKEATGISPLKADAPQEVTLPKATAPAALALEYKAVAAHICVEVLHTEANDGRQFTLRCLTPQGEWKGPWNLPQDTRVLVGAYLEGAMNSEKGALIAALHGAGMDLWKALPKQVATLILEAVEQGAKTMSVLSEEPYIPWELMRPYRRIPDAMNPLGLMLQMGRWVTGEYIAPPQRIPLRSLFLVAPTTSELECAPKEVKFLLQTLKKELSPRTRLTPASVVGIDTGLGKGSRDVLHFICHGRSATLQTLELESPDTLNSSTVLALEGFQKAFKKRPLVFLNACEVGGRCWRLMASEALRTLLSNSGRRPSLRLCGR